MIESEDDHMIGAVILEAQRKESEHQVLYGFELLGRLCNHRFKIKDCISHVLHEDHLIVKRKPSRNAHTAERVVSVCGRSIRAWEDDCEVKCQPIKSSQMDFIQAITYVESKNVYIAAALDMHLKIFHGKTLEEEASIELKNKSIFAVAFNEQLNEAVTGGVHNITFWKWEEDRKEVWDASSKLWKSVIKYNLLKHVCVELDELLHSFDFEQESGLIFAYSEPGLLVYDATAKEKLYDVRNMNMKGVSCCIKHANKETYVTGSSDGKIRLWSVHTRFELGFTFRSHARPITGLLFHPADPSELFLSSSLDGSVRVYCLALQTELYRVNLEEPCQKMLLTSSKHPNLLVVSGNSATQFRLAHVTRTFAPCRSNVMKLSTYYWPDPTMTEPFVFSLCTDGTMRTSNSRGFNISTTILHDKSSFVDVYYSFSFDGVTAIKPHGTISLFSMDDNDGRKLMELPAAYFGNDPPSCLTVCTSSYLNETALEQQTLKGLSCGLKFQGFVKDFAVKSNVVEYIVVGTKGGHLIVWNTKRLDQRPLKLFYGDGGQFLRLHFVDGPQPVLICLSISGKLFCLSLQSFETMWQRSPINDEETDTTITCFCSRSSSLRYLCFGTSNGSLGMLNVTDGQSVLPLNASSDHVGRVNVCAFHPSYDLIASGGQDGIIKLRNFQNLLVGEVMIAFQPIRSMTFVKDKLLINEKDNISMIAPENYIPLGPDPKIEQEVYVSSTEGFGMAQSSRKQSAHKVEPKAAPKPKPPRLKIKKDPMHQSPLQQNRYLKLMTAIDTIQLSPAQMQLTPPPMRTTNQAKEPG